MPVIGMGRIGELLHELGERWLVAQRQPDGQVQPSGGGRPANRLQARQHRRHVAAQELPSGCRPRPERGRRARLSHLSARRWQEGEVFGGKQEQQSEGYE